MTKIEQLEADLREVAAMFERAANGARHVTAKEYPRIRRTADLWLRTVRDAMRVARAMKKGGADGQ